MTHRLFQEVMQLSEVLHCVQQPEPGDRGLREKPKIDRPKHCPQVHAMTARVHCRSSLHSPTDIYIYVCNMYPWSGTGLRGSKVSILPGRQPASVSHVVVKLFSSANDNPGVGGMSLRVATVAFQGPRSCAFQVVRRCSIIDGRYC